MRMAVSSFASTVFTAPPRPQRLPLAANEALIAVTIDALPAWELAGRLAAPTFVLVTPSRACMFDHLLTIGLFAITAGPSDFYARLVSRATALPGMPPQGPVDLHLLADTAHHASRAIADHVGHRLSEAEKATLIERLWRATKLARTPAFVAREDEYLRLQALARSQNVQMIWGDPASHITGGELSRTLSDRNSEMGCLALFDREAIWSRSYSPAAWKRIPQSAGCAVLLASRAGTEETTVDTLAAIQPHPSPTLTEEPAITRTLEESDVEVVLRLLEESLAQPIPALLPALFRFVDEHRPTLEARVTEEGRALLSLCDGAELHDDDQSWRALSSALLQAPEAEQVYHANALAHRLGLFT